jgi:iron complex outermembrane receptor protein
VGAAESEGLELDAIWLASESLTLSLSYAYNKAELMEDYFARQGNTTPDASAGQDLPFTPDNKVVLGGDYAFSLMGLSARASANYTYTDAMWNDIFLSNREQMDSYGLLGASVSVEGDGWRASLFGRNLTGEVAELYINTVDIQRLVTVNQPRTIGVSVGMSFD